MIAIWHFYSIAFILSLGFILWQSPKPHSLVKAILIYIAINLFSILAHIAYEMIRLNKGGPTDTYFVVDTTRIFVVQIFAAIFFIPLLIGLSFIIKWVKSKRS